MGISVQGKGTRDERDAKRTVENGTSVEDGRKVWNIGKYL